MEKTYKISTIKDFLSIKDLNGNYILTKNIDLQGTTIKPIGSKDKPFTGSFNGNCHTLFNYNVESSNKLLGIFGYNKGKIFNFYNEEVNYIKKDNNGIIFGAIAAINKGEIGNVVIDKAKAILNINNGQSSIGGLIGENYTTIQNCKVSLDLKVNNKSDNAYIGQLIGKSYGGLLETLTFDGLFEINSDKKISVCNLVSYMDNSIIRACKGYSYMNTLNGKCIKDLYNEEKDSYHFGNYYRDNTNALCFLPKSNQEVRYTVKKHMQDMATIEWTPNRTLEYKCSCDANVHHQVFEKDIKQYGIPYTHKLNSLESFKDCFDENGDLKSHIKSYGYDGFDNYMGVDCSGAIYWSWSKVDDGINFMWTHNELPFAKKGSYPVGKYNWKEKKTHLIYGENGGDGGSEQYNLAECIAKAHVGDAIVSCKPSLNHTRMITKDPYVIRQENGVIDVFSSKIFTTEQGDGLLYKPSEQLSKSWLVDKEYLFITILREKYIPVTCKALMNGEASKEKVKYIKPSKGNLVTNGKIESNYRIISVEAKIIEDGNEIFNKRIYTSLKGWAEKGNDENARITAREFNLKEFKPYFDTKLLKKDHKYLYELSTVISTGNKITLLKKEIKG